MDAERKIAVAKRLSRRARPGFAAMDQIDARREFASVRREFTIVKWMAASGLF